MPNIYANSEDETLTFTGTLVEGDTYEVTLAKDNGATFAGWNLVGNHLDCFVPRNDAKRQLNN